MTATMTTARDEMLAVFNAVWEPLGHPVSWPDVADTDLPPATQIPWARVTINHVAAEQATLANHAGVSRFRRVGFMTVQIFTPAGGGGILAYSLGQTVMNAFQGVSTASGVWFRNVRFNEIGIDGDWYQANVVLDFEYDQVV